VNTLHPVGRRYFLNYSLPLSSLIPGAPREWSMQERTQSPSDRVPVSEFRSFGWPVKIRVRATNPLLAPRRSPIFPASLMNQDQPTLLLRTVEIEAPTARANRRAHGVIKWQ
jgi:hypothetical protein